MKALSGPGIDHRPALVGVRLNAGVMDSSVEAIHEDHRAQATNTPRDRNSAGLVAGLAVVEEVLNVVRSDDIGSHDLGRQGLGQQQALRDAVADRL